MLLEAFDSKRVLVTGHTGFKGSWLCEWLVSLGADVTGYSLPPPTEPSLFRQLELEQRVTHCLGDVRNTSAVRDLVQRLEPEFIFHLAAQPLVRQSYSTPVETFATNLVGTVNVLDAVRTTRVPSIVVVATTDKCYENLETNTPFHEADRLGGRDPYSASKACAELAASAYRTSYFQDPYTKPCVATARAGNVLGGGDWAADRIIPDCVRALRANQPIQLRNPGAIRPWQHVLESLSGYLVLAARISEARYFQKTSQLESLCSAFNFGPPETSEQSVRVVVDKILTLWPGTWIAENRENEARHEARLLRLSIEKARTLLGWRPVWSLEKTVENTIEWYRAVHDKGKPDAVREITQGQIKMFSAEAKQQQIEWTS